MAHSVRHEYTILDSKESTHLGHDISDILVVFLEQIFNQMLKVDSVTAASSDHTPVNLRKDVMSAGESTA